MTSKKHYHVLVGTPGYMPDVNIVCRTKKDAEHIARDRAAQERDYVAQYNEDIQPEYPRHVSGNANDGYEVWSDDPYDLGTKIHISQCWAPECLEYLDD